MRANLSALPNTAFPRGGKRLHDPSRLLAVAATLSGLRGDTTTGLQVLVDSIAEALPGATVAANLIWTDNSFIIAAHGMPEWIMEAGGVPAAWAPCALVVEHDSPLLIDDTHAFAEHADNPVVTVCGVRSYAGVPLRDAGGELVGTLIAMSTTPGAFDAGDLRTLTAAAAQATGLLLAAR